MHGAVMVLTLALLGVLGPCATETVRAPDWINCPRCDQRTWVIVEDESVSIDYQPTVVDCNGVTHYHDVSSHTWSVKCCRCLLEWDETQHAAPCHCGWRWDRPIPLPDCGQSSASAPSAKLRAWATRTRAG